MLSICYRPEICFEDREQRCIRLNRDMMDYLTEHMEDDGDDIIEVFYVDIDETIISELSAMAQTDEECDLIADLIKYDCEWISVAPYVYVG